MPDTDSRPFQYSVRVEFRDTDAAGIAHFSNFFLWMERSEHALLRSLGLTVMDHEASHPISWLRVAASCEYHAPVKFEQEVRVSVSVTKLGTKSVTYGFRFEHADRHVATGKVTVVCSQQDDRGKWNSTPIPDSIREQLSRLS